MGSEMCIRDRSLPHRRLRCLNDSSHASLVFVGNWRLIFLTSARLFGEGERCSTVAVAGLRGALLPRTGTVLISGALSLTAAATLAFLNLILIIIIVIVVLINDLISNCDRGSGDSVPDPVPSVMLELRAEHSLFSGRFVRNTNQNFSKLISSWFSSIGIKSANSFVPTFFFGFFV